MQIRETAGFARPFSAHPSQKNPGIQQVFPDFSISSGRKMPRAKLRSTANREIFVSGEAPGAEILDMYSEHRQQCLARKDTVCGCRIPNLHALMRVFLFLKRGGWVRIRRMAFDSDTSARGQPRASRRARNARIQAFPLRGRWRGPSPARAVTDEVKSKV